jgi:hypothetical protein
MRSFLHGYAAHLRRLALVAVLPALWAAPQQPPVDSADGAIEIEKIELADVGMERVRLAVYPVVVPFQDAELAGITFFGLRLNDIPIFIPPVSETMLMQVGHRFRLRQPLQVSIYYRDLASLDPIVQLVRNGKLRLEGNAVFEAKLSLLPSLFLRSRTARAPMRFQVEVPVTLPGNRLTQAAALKILEFVEPGSRLARDKIVALLDSTESRQSVLEHYGKGVFFAMARYSLVDRDGKRFPLQVNGLAFRVDPRRLMLPRELVEPWRFDPALALQIKSKKFSVAQGSYELLLWPQGAAVAGPGGNPRTENAFSSLKNQFKIVTSGSNVSERMVATETGASATLISILQRASTSNLALVEFPDAPPGGGVVPDIDRHPDPNGYTSLVAFRFGAGAWMEKADPEIVGLSAKLVNGRLILDNPMDASAWGSPMVSANGVVGMLQDEKSGILFTSAADALKLGVMERKAGP